MLRGCNCRALEVRVCARGERGEGVCKRGGCDRGFSAAMDGTDAKSGRENAWYACGMRLLGH